MEIDRKPLSHLYLIITIKEQEIVRTVINGNSPSPDSWRKSKSPKHSRNASQMFEMR